MFASVRGMVTSVGTSSVVVESGGIGYEILVPAGVALGTVAGTEAHFHTVLIPREDEWLLFGFWDAESKQLFSALRSVSGVGPKTALAVLSTLSTAEIDDAVGAGDADRFTSVPGIGAKTASLIVVSLTGKMPQSSNRDVVDVISALTGLGWTQSDASEAARSVVAELPSATLAERIRLALGRLGSS
jgi:Holliday junction DNA helicase RuvA